MLVAFIDISTVCTSIRPKIFSFPVRLIFLKFSFVDQSIAKNELPMTFHKAIPKLTNVLIAIDKFYFTRPMQAGRTQSFTGRS